MLALEPLVHPLNLAQDGAQQNSMHRAEFAVSMSLTIFLDYVRGDSTCYVDGFRVRVLAIAFSWQRRGGFLRVICVCFRCNIVR